MAHYGAILDVFFLHLLHVSWQAGVLAAIIFVVQRLLRGYLSPGWCEVLWIVLLIRLMLPWAPASSFSVYNVPHQAVSAASTLGLFDGSGVPAQEAAQTPALEAEPSPAVHTAFHAASIPWTRVGSVIWLAGTLAIVAFMIAQNQWLSGAMAKRRVLTDSEALDLLESCKSLMGVNTWIAPIMTPRVQSPALLGVVRPRLLLPEHWEAMTTAEQRRHIFLHELGHVRRYDVLRGWVWGLMVALHWFNPLIWWARNRVGRDREVACDARALSVLNPGERLSYGQTLLDQFQHFRQFRLSYGAAGVLEQAANMKRRITMALNYSETSTVGKVVAAAALLAVGLFGLTDVPTVAAGDGAKINIHSTIIPGRGFQALGIGDTKEAVLAKLGMPDEGSEACALDYRHHLGTEFFADGDRPINRISFYGKIEGGRQGTPPIKKPALFAGRTSDGIGFGDSIDAAIQASGGAVRIEEVEQSAGYEEADRVLYQWKHRGQRCGYKFNDEHKGIVYWADPNKGIERIDVFAAKEKSDSVPAVRPSSHTGTPRAATSDKDDSVATQTYPFSIFAFAPKAGSNLKDAGELLDAFNASYPRGVKCRTHHYRTAHTDGRLVGFICADNAAPIATMLKDHPKLECLSTRIIEESTDFEKYLALSDEERAKSGLSF